MSAPLCIYIHWPFCASKCPYCDFNSHAAKTINQRRWRNALLREMEHFAKQTKTRTITSIFFGGGTPSLMRPDTVARLISLAKQHWQFSDNIEITLEANPTSVEAHKFKAFAKAGINRLSLGVQSLDDKALKFLGRNHTAKQALSAIDLAASHFKRFSFDMIYALPGQSVKHWQDELNKALSVAGGHISLYQLSVEAGTIFQQKAIKEAGEDIGAALYKVSGKVLQDAGFNAYEVSNYAKNGNECRHNLACWRGSDYLAIGPGAHGRLTTNNKTDAIEQIRDPKHWLKAVEENDHGTSQRITLSQRQRLDELILTGLRLNEGVRRDLFGKPGGMDIEKALNNHALQRMIKGGFITIDDKSLKATNAGRLRLNAVLAEILSF